MLNVEQIGTYENKGQVVSDFMDSNWTTLNVLLEETRLQIQHQKVWLDVLHNPGLLHLRAYLVHGYPLYEKDLTQFEGFLWKCLNSKEARSGEIHCQLPTHDPPSREGFSPPSQGDFSPYESFLGSFLKAARPGDPFFHAPNMLKQLHAFIDLADRSLSEEDMINTDGLWTNERMKQWIMFGDPPCAYLQIPPRGFSRFRRFSIELIRHLEMSCIVVHMLSCGLPQPFQDFLQCQETPIFILQQLVYQALFHIRPTISALTLKRLLESLVLAKTEEDWFRILEVACVNSGSSRISVIVEITDKIPMGKNVISKWPSTFSTMSSVLKAKFGIRFQALILCPGPLLDGIDWGLMSESVIDWKPMNDNTTFHVSGRRMPQRRPEQLPATAPKAAIEPEIITLSDDSSTEDVSTVVASVEESSPPNVFNISSQNSALAKGKSSISEVDNSIAGLPTSMSLDAQSPSTPLIATLLHGNTSKPSKTDQELTDGTEKTKNRHHIKLAIVCALTLEADAVHALFEEHWEDLEPTDMRSPGDTNAYSFGVFGRFATVLVHMPGMGKMSASIVATNCRSSFPNLKLALVVGICGGVPFCNNGKTEIVLGDVIISEGLIAYDYGRRYPDRFMRRDSASNVFGKPPTALRGLLSKLKGRFVRRRLQERLAAYLQTLKAELGDEVGYLGAEEDLLFEGTYTHRHRDPELCGVCSDSAICKGARSSTCDELACDKVNLISRKRLDAILRGETASEPAVHFGYIACGDQVMKSGNHRDIIAREEGVIAFEMEGAGVWDIFPCLVIKSVCDYADSHKHKKWQGYAAGAAAACTKALIQEWYM